MALSNNDIIQAAKAVAADVRVVEHHGDLTLVVKMADLLNVLYELKDSPLTAFNLLIDITAIDWARPGERFEVVYFLSSLANAARVRVKVGVHLHATLGVHLHLCALARVEASLRQRLECGPLLLQRFGDTFLASRDAPLSAALALLLQPMVEAV